MMMRATRQAEARRVLMLLALVLAGCVCCCLPNAAGATLPSGATSGPCILGSSMRRLGCYADNPSRSLPVQLASAGDMSPSKCANLAFQHGFTYFGLQYGAECWAGNDLPRATSLDPSSACTMACTGDRSQTCGNAYTFDLYQVDSNCPDTMVIGCYKDDGSRVLPYTLAMTSDMTPAKCGLLARQNGYSIFGVEYGSQCYAGNDIQRATRLGSSTSCNVDCSGWPQMGGMRKSGCGGAWALDIYQWVHGGGCGAKCPGNCIFREDGNHYCDEDKSNLALNKPTYSSSVYVLDSIPLLPKFAVDGVTRYSVLSSSAPQIFHSASSDSQPWFSIDLGNASSLVGRVVIYNRCDCCAQRLQNAELRIGNVSVTQPSDTAVNLGRNPLAWKQSALIGQCASMTITFSPPKVGRWLTLQNLVPNCQGDACALQLTEVQVYSSATDERTYQSQRLTGTNDPQIPYTALRDWVDGCSNPNPMAFMDVMNPVCNAHDLCYRCAWVPGWGLSRFVCDVILGDSGVRKCKETYRSWWDYIPIFGAGANCVANAKLMMDGLIVWKPSTNPDWCHESWRPLINGWFTVGKTQEHCDQYHMAPC